MSANCKCILFATTTILCFLGLSTRLALALTITDGFETTRLQQCREGCLEKFSAKESLCQQHTECSACWDECAKPASTTLKDRIDEDGNDEEDGSAGAAVSSSTTAVDSNGETPTILNKPIRETWSLHTVSMLQQDSLVLVDVAWQPTYNTPNQCLVTWEVSGGGLMGNLLTESFNVQLSLWPETKYRVQVTCKNKNTGEMSRSLPLNIDTSEALQSTHTKPIKVIASTVLPIKTIDSFKSDSILPPILNENGFAQYTDIDSDEKDQESSKENDRHHTDFFFNWHMHKHGQEFRQNDDISRIEPIAKPNLDLITIAALSDLQQPLLVGVIVGSIFLAVILVLYILMLRSQSAEGPSDKSILIAEEENRNNNVVLQSTTVDIPEPCSSQTCHQHVLKV